MSLCFSIQVHTLDVLSYLTLSPPFASCVPLLLVTPPSLSPPTRCIDFLYYYPVTSGIEKCAPQTMPTVAAIDFSSDAGSRVFGTEAGTAADLTCTGGGTVTGSIPSSAPTMSPTNAPTTTPQPTPSPTMLGYTYAPTAVLLGDAVVPSDKSQEEEQTKTTLIVVGIIGFVTLLCIALVFLLFLVLLLIRKKKLDGGSNIQKSAKKKKKKKKKKKATITTVDSNSLSDVELQDGEAGGVSRAAGVWHTVNKAFKNKATSLPADQSMPRGQATRQSTPRDITGIVGGTPWKHSDAFKQYISR